jgi:hypothetical protein
MKLLTLVLFTVFAFCMTAFAQVAPPETVDGMSKFIPQFITAIGEGDYKVIGGVVLMLLMVVVRQFVLPKAKLDPVLLPFIMAVMTGLSFSGLAMLDPQVEIGEAFKTAFLTSGAAMMMWELGGKLLFKLLLGDSYVEKGQAVFPPK